MGKRGRAGREEKERKGKEMGKGEEVDGSGSI